MRLVPALAGGDVLAGFQVGLEHQLVDGLLFRRETPADREGAGDVAGVAVDLAAGVDQHQIAGVERGVILPVVQNAGVAAPGDDRAVSRQTRTALAEFVFQLGFQLVLVQPGAAGAHGAHVGTGGHLRGVAHDLQLRRGLAQAQRMQQLVDSDELARRRHALAYLGAHVVGPAQYPQVEAVVLADGVVDPPAVFHQRRQQRVDGLDGKGIVGAVVAHRTVLAGASPIPQFTLRITVATEQDVLPLLAAGHQHQHRFRFREAAQVLEVAVLAIGMLDVAVAQLQRRRRQDGDAAGLHARHQLGAAAGIFDLRDADHRQLPVSAGRVWRRRRPAWRIRRTAAAAPRAGIP